VTPARAARRLGAGLLAGVGAGAVLAVVAPVAAGWHPLTVMSGSMTPAIRTGDVVVTRPVRATTIAPGDVVTFRDPENAHRLITHRVRRVVINDSTVSVVTRGDANTGVEHWDVARSGSVGRVVYKLPRAGYVLHRVATPWGRLAFVGLPLLLWGLLTLRAIWRADEAPPEVPAAVPDPVPAAVLPLRPAIAAAPVRPALCAAPVRPAIAAAPVRPALCAAPARDDVTEVVPFPRRAAYTAHRTHCEGRVVPT
jgi:signal peptidase